MSDARDSGTSDNPQADRWSVRSFAALALMLVPLMLGARDCERVVVGEEECPNGPCPADGGVVDGCEVDGMHYAVGDDVPSADGCNSCGCDEFGHVVCTQRACDNSCGGLLGRDCAASQYCKYAPAAQCGAADQTGACTLRPQACPTIYSPVCGCDDKTYGNECEAASAGTSVSAEGECAGGTPGATCGGLLGQPCANGEYCNFPPDAMCGRADATGTCAVIPNVCTEEYAPVCGCDGKTYGNACSAAGAGVSVEKRGECMGPLGASCGSRGQPQCASGEYCNFPLDAQCGATDRPGNCTKVPQGCTAEGNPVCGCDGKTYGNPCFAALEGVAIAARGACLGGGSGATCGGIAGLDCPNDGEFCSYSPSAQCGAADQTGTCERIPDACDTIYQPVCGCDDKTYGNGCEAALASVSVAARGECGGGGSGQSCGGFIGEQCPDGEYCNYPPESYCGRADGPGTCAMIGSGACILLFAPVCGCDGITYDNDCHAASKGVSVETQGACR